MINSLQHSNVKSSNLQVGQPSLINCMDLMGFKHLNKQERNSRWNSGLVSSSCKDLLIKFSQMTIDKNIVDRRNANSISKKNHH